MVLPYTPKKIKTLYGSLSVALGGLTVAAWGAIHTVNRKKIIEIEHFSIGYKIDDQDGNSLTGDCTVFITEDLKYYEITECSHPDIFTKNTRSLKRPWSNETGWKYHSIVASGEIN